MVGNQTTRLLLPGIDLVTAPLRMVAATTRHAVETGTAIAGLAVEALGGTPRRRCSSKGKRHWIEVRGLEAQQGREIGAAVLAALEGTSGVCNASLNSAVARVVVTVEDDGPSAAELVKIVNDAERRVASNIPRRWPTTLPGDDDVVVARIAAAAVATAGFGLAVTGSTLRLGLPEWVSVPSTMLDHIPTLRTRIEQQLGPDGTDFIFALVNTATAGLTTSPSSAAAEAATRAMLAAEAWNARRAWHKYEAELAQHPSDASPRITQTSAWSAERYDNRAGATGLAAAAALGLLSANPRTAGLAALVGAPKPVRTTREAFGCALTRGLSDQHGALVLHPRVLRRLDCIDTVVIDPRVL